MRISDWSSDVCSSDLGLALTGCALAADAVMLALAMAVCGLAAGVVLPTTYALAGDLAPQDLRSRAVGRVIVGWSVAMVLGVPAAALLAEQLGWPGAYAIITGVAGTARSEARRGGKGGVGTCGSGW